MIWSNGIVPFTLPRIDLHVHQVLPLILLGHDGLRRDHVLELGVDRLVDDVARQVRKLLAARPSWRRPGSA